jgi:hypothetical protein
MTIRSGTGQATLSPEGVFDLAEGGRGLGAARSLAGRRLAVDFHGLREIHDSALAALVSGLGSASREVELRGLTGHQRRMLDYLAARSRQGGPGGSAGDDA